MKVTEGGGDVSVQREGNSMPVMSRVQRRRHSLRVSMFALMIVSAMPTQRIKYSTWATVPADINNARAPRTIYTTLALC